MSCNTLTRRHKLFKVWRQICSTWVQARLLQCTRLSSKRSNTVERTLIALRTQPRCVQGKYWWRPFVFWLVTLFSDNSYQIKKAFKKVNSNNQMLSSFGFSPPQGPKFHRDRRPQYTSNSYIIHEEHNKRGSEKRSSIAPTKHKSAFSDNQRGMVAVNNSHSAVSNRNNR